MSWRVLVPRMFRRVVAARRRVENWAFSTLMTDRIGAKIRKYTTASTVTVTESLVSISCGGTSKVTVRRSTTTMLSVQGRMKKRPGPLGSFAIQRP